MLIRNVQSAVTTLQNTTKPLLHKLKGIPLHRIPSMKTFETRMRKILCSWSFILDKRAARDAHAFKAS
eukprot:11826831-Prorocentrum_lima.AAC.1